MRRLEKSHAQRASVAFETVSQGGERTVCIHPFAEVGDDLLAGLGTVQRFKFFPLLLLRLADEIQKPFPGKWRGLG